MDNIEILGTIHRNHLANVELKVVQRKSDLQVYVLKTVKCNGNQSRLSHEWEILTNIASFGDGSCRHIVGIADFWRETAADKFGNHWWSRECLLIEACEGGPLHRQIQLYGQLPTYRARIYSFEIVTALVYLHDVHNCVHRDLKASNVLIDCHGHVKLADFGSAKILPDNGRTFTIIGTLHCMAPEMVARSIGYDFTVDWWSLGVLIYEMLTGSPPQFTWHRKPGNNMIKDDILCSECQSSFAQKLIDQSHEFISTDWHFEAVDELLSLYPDPPLPKGDILNSIKIVEQRIAFEEVKLAHDLIRDLLIVPPQSRLKIARQTVNCYEWFKEVVWTPKEIMNLSSMMSVLD